MSNETYYYGQGRISLALIDPLTLAAGKFIWIGDVSAFSLKPAAAQVVKHQESYSGQKGTVRNFPVGSELNVDMTLHQFDPANMARVLRSTVVSTATGTVTSESLGASLAVGDEVYLANPGVSALVIKDSAVSTPATLVKDIDYSVDTNFGRVTILNVGTYVQPFKADYSYSARVQVGMFTQGQQNYALKYEGLNLAEGNAPVMIDLYKLAPDLVQDLALITTGTDVAGFPMAGVALLDSSKPATGALGQFAHITQLVAA